MKLRLVKDSDEFYLYNPKLSEDSFTVRLEEIAITKDASLSIHSKNVIFAFRIFFISHLMSYHRLFIN